MALHLCVVGAVLDGEGRCGAVAAVGDALDLDEVWPASAHEIHVLAQRLGRGRGRVGVGVGVELHLLAEHLRVPPVDERQPEDGALLLEA